MSKQSALGRFKGFSRTVNHRGQEITVTLPTELEDKGLQCRRCEKKFKNQQGLSVHEKCVHGLNPKVYTDQPAPADTSSNPFPSGDSPSSTDQPPSAGALAIVDPPTMEDSPAAEDPSTMEDPPTAENPPTIEDPHDPMDAIPSTSAGAPSRPPAQDNRRGQAKRASYTVEKKAEVINTYESGLSYDEVIFTSHSSIR